MADVFVSYSRRDSEFVGKLARSIEERGKDVWLDVEGIADGEVFPEAIKRAIEQSDAFVFLITPASVASSYCENEVDYARETAKRIVPVLRDPVADTELPAEIRDRNWIPFIEDTQFEASLELAAPLVTTRLTTLERTAVDDNGSRGRGALGSQRRAARAPTARFRAPAHVLSEAVTGLDVCVTDSSERWGILPLCPAG
jgi:hypothetical protein